MKEKSILSFRFQMVFAGLPVNEACLIQRKTQLPFAYEQDNYRIFSYFRTSFLCTTAPCPKHISIQHIGVYSMNSYLLQWNNL